jgi:hypothetical protein
MGALATLQQERLLARTSMGGQWKLLVRRLENDVVGRPW